MPYDLYVLTDREIGLGRTHQEIAREATAGGADVIQFRDKSLPFREFIETAEELRDITAGSGAMFIVNDRIDVALAVKADGVHLGQSDMPAGYARRISPPGFIIGVSVGNVDEAIVAEASGADYVALSPVFSTGSKDDAGPGHGLEMLAEIRSNVVVPVIGIGGIGFHNVMDVVSAGADGIAVISAVSGADDIRSAAEKMKKLIAGEKRKTGSVFLKRAGFK
jgi:thiamine-phosphate pyrophosphorylase